MSLSYIIRRLLQLIPTLIGITLITFIIVRLTGDPAAILLPPDTPQEVVDEFRAEYGLDKPVYIQYALFMAKAVQGDFGESLRYKVPVLDLFIERIPATVELIVVSMALAIFLGIPIGMVSAVKHNTWVDNFLRFWTFLFQAIPSFYLGLMLILLVAVPVEQIPTGGRETWRHLILPSIALAAYLVAVFARFTRGSMLDVLNKDYVRTARAKGLTEKSVMWAHVLKNSMIPIITIIGLRAGALLGGAVVIETVFAWPGIGRLMVQAIATRDFPVIQVTVLFVATIFVLLNLLVDLTYTWLDPRIGYA